MIIVVDGPRGCGKSSLINYLVEISDGFVRLFKAERSENPFLSMLDSIELFTNDDNIVWIIDRFHLTEYVMSSLLDRGDHETLLKQAKQIHSLLDQHKALVIYLDANDESIRNRLVQREGNRQLDVPDLIDALAFWQKVIKEHFPTTIVLKSDTHEQFIQNVDYIALRIKLWYVERKIVYAP